MWYAIDQSSGIILAWHNGGRTDADFLCLLGYLSQIPIDKYCIDDWDAYSRNLPVKKHRIGKDRTWKIERKKSQFQDTHQTIVRKNDLLFQV